MGSFDLAQELATTTAEERGTKLHDEGDYTFGVKKAEDGGFSKNGTPQLLLQVEFLEGQYRGHTVNRNVYYSNKSQGGIRFFWSQMKGLGLDEDYLQATGQTSFDQIALLVQGAQFNGKIRHREFPIDSGTYQEEVTIGKPISNPNVGDGAVTGVVQPPAGPAPEVFPDDEDAPLDIPVATDGAPVVADEDDPWGAVK